MTTDFVPWPKTPRLTNECMIVTEKIDGTNAQVFITEDGTIRAGSRNRWITPEDDNYGFAAWVRENQEELLKLGPGRHYGEWWGRGIQRGYGMADRHFSLFEVHRWWKPGLELPACVNLVPVLHQGIADSVGIHAALDRLKAEGSLASPGFRNPEGIIVQYLTTKARYKYLIDNPHGHKGDNAHPEGIS